MRREVNRDLALVLLHALFLIAGFAFFALYRGQIKGNWILPAFLGLWPFALGARGNGVSKSYLRWALPTGLLQTVVIAAALKYLVLLASVA